MEAPKGCVVTLTGTTGAVFVGYSFSNSKPGGFSLKNAQKMRAEENLGRNFMKQSSSIWLHDKFELWDIWAVIDQLINRDKWVKNIVYIGYEDDKE